MGNCRYQRTAHRMTSAGKRKPRNARASVMSSALGSGAGGSAAPTRLRAIAQRNGTHGCAERFIRTLKENLLWVRHFATVEELRLALLAFQRTYNQTWIIERHGYKTPAQIRDNQIGPMPMAA